MIKPWQFALFFLLCLLLALLFNLPARQVLPHLKLHDTVRLVGVDGTVFSGTVREIIINGLPLSELNYRYLPSCLPLLKVCYKISYKPGTAQYAYDVLNGDTKISQARIEYPVSELARHVPNLLFKPVGNVELEIADLTMVQGKSIALNGKLIGRGLGLDNDGSRISIGDYQIDFSGDQQKYKFKLSDLNANLDVAGEGEIKADGQYEVDIKINAEGALDPQIKKLLGLVAAEAGYNQYRFEQKGRLPPNLTRQLFQ